MPNGLNQPVVKAKRSQAERWELRRAVAKLRTEGYYDAREIWPRLPAKFGAKLGEVRHAMVIIDREHARRAAQVPAIERSIMLETVDRLLQTAIPYAERGNHFFMQRAIQLLERKAKLLNLDLEAARLPFGAAQQAGQVTINTTINQTLIESKLAEFEQLYEAQAALKEPVHGTNGTIIDLEPTAVPELLQSATERNGTSEPLDS